LEVSFGSLDWPNNFKVICEAFGKPEVVFAPGMQPTEANFLRSQLKEGDVNGGAVSQPKLVCISQPRLDKLLVGFHSSTAM
jgi:hypothetical protein